MKAFRILLYILCLPAFLLYSIPISTHESPFFKNDEGKELYVPRDTSGNFNPWELYKIENFTFDRIFEFTELLEQDEFWESLSQEEFETLMDYCIWAMRFSVPKSRFDLKENAESEIDRLLKILNEDDSKPLFSLNQDFNFQLQSAKCIQNPHFFKCGWFSDKYKKAKKWIKKIKVLLSFAL